MKRENAEKTENNKRSQKMGAFIFCIARSIIRSEIIRVVKRALKKLQ